MSEEQDVREIRRIVGLLEKTHRLARDASMTGALSGGKDYVIQQFNAIVANLTERGMVGAGFFPTLGEQATFDEVGIACAQLADYLRADLPEDEETHWKGRGRKVHTGPGSFNISVGDIPDLKNLGQIIRESLPEWMRAARERRETGEPAEPAEPAAHAAPPSSAANPGGGSSGDLSELRHSGSGAATSLTELESRLAEVGAKIQVVAEQMRREELPPGELQRLANELSHLGREQSEIAQTAAARRTLGEER